MTTERQSDNLLDHEYDGIKEFDNPLPFWWVGLFWATILFSAFYMVYYHMGPGPSVIDEYTAGMNEIYDLQMKELLKLGPISDGMIAKLAKDPAKMSGAKALFQSKCSPCHGMQGQGNIGPNLTDDNWIHGGRPLEIYTTIREGVPAKGMLTWKNQLSAYEMLSVAGYVTTLHGTNPPNPKAPEGPKVDWDAIQAAIAASEKAPAAPAKPGAAPVTPPTTPASPTGASPAKG